jgi:CheY-like chemotaxis protein
VPSKRSAPWTTRPDLSNRNILIIEDDPDSREFLREVLTSCRATVLDTDNVATAKDCVSNSKFDLIVTDLSLPGEDGAAFLKWLRRQPPEKGGATLAIAVTAFYEDYPPASVSGWAAYLQKPVDPELFVRTVADLLKIPVPDA